ncbi:MAG: hypothetical protein H0T46_32960 [Deltaproteobacteria bacterium]|nr:hypothetical protein [Deltaproteobacteria bacterium]
MKLATVLGLTLTSLAACAGGEGTSSSSLTQEPGNCGSLETHVIGIREGHQGKASVHVKRPVNQALVLSAREATTWTVTVEPGVVLEAVYAVGIGKQTVRAPEGVKVVTDSKVEGGPWACGYTYPASGTDCNTENLLDLIDKRVHAPTSFHGCAQAGLWTIEENMAVIGNCNGDFGPIQTDMVQGCDGEDSCGGPIFL